MIAMIIARAFLFPNGSVITSVAILLYCNRNHMKSTQKKKSSHYELVVQGNPEKGRSERSASPHQSLMERFNNTWGSCRHGSPAKVHALFEPISCTMAASAAAAAAAGSSFSPSSIHPFKRMHIKHCPLDHSLLKVSPARIMLASLYRSDYVIEPLAQVAVTWRVPRVSAAFAQEEAPATASAVEEEELASEEAKGETNEIPVNTKLYFGNLPYNVDSAQLAGIIQEYGSPEMVEVLYHRETGRSRGFAFVTMSSIEDCNAVIENLDESQYMGRLLRVNFSDNPKPKEPLYPETEYKLFVGNLSWSATSESLTQAFQEYGDVVGARVLYDGETGKSRGYGFVCYSTKAEMQTALVSLDGVELEGRALRVSLAQGRKS
ncbi:hypothetical protein NC652_025108 [Populus alba x Populus x berolinensis]|nr:hypothetical protein NC652_025108 [Populus alba x Populus x berolinensis]